MGQTDIVNLLLGFLIVACVYVSFHRSLAEMAAATSVHVVAIVEPIIQHADWFFPDGNFWSPAVVFLQLTFVVYWPTVTEEQIANTDDEVQMYPWKWDQMRWDFFKN